MRLRDDEVTQLEQQLQNIYIPPIPTNKEVPKNCFLFQKRLFNDRPLTPTDQQRFASHVGRDWKRVGRALQKNCRALKGTAIDNLAYEYEREGLYEQAYQLLGRFIQSEGRNARLGRLISALEEAKLINMAEIMLDIQPRDTLNFIPDRSRPGLTMPSAPLTYRAPVEIGLLLVEEVEEGGECTDRERRGKVGCELEEKERFWSELDEVMESIPTGERVVIGADFNEHVGEGNTGDEEVMGEFGVKERNLEGQMVVDFAKRMDMAVVNTYFQKREEHRVTYKSGGRRTQKLRQALGGQVVLPDDWETTAEVIRETGRKVLGVSSGRRKEDKETWWWNEEVQDSVQRKRLAKKKWDMDRTEENRQEYKELQRRVKREVSKAKQKAYDELYTRLDTREGEKDLYRLARQRDRDGKDVQQVRVIKDRDGRVLTSEESVQKRWKEYFEELMNEENEREKRVEGVNSVEQKVDKIRKDEVRKALKRMKSGKAVGPDDIPVEVWKCLGEATVEFLTSLFNRVLESERMPEEWRSVLVLIFKNKGDVQSCSNYRGIKLMSHTMKLWERVVEARLRKVVEICEQQYGFMPRKSTTDAIFALRILMEKYRDGQRELHCVFVDLEKAYDRVPREELWYCMRKSGVAEKYVRVVQDMYERSRTVVRCAVGQTEEFNVEVGLHQGSALSPFLFAIVMDQLSEEVRQESPWTMMFADDIVICSESREQVEENLERWRFALERRGMKVSGSKTEYMCVNEREGSGTVRLQGEEVKKIQEFKYLGSTVQSNGECGKEVKKRVQAASKIAFPCTWFAHTTERAEKRFRTVSDVSTGERLALAQQQHGGRMRERGEELAQPPPPSPPRTRHL
ncbi:hypothetical protein QTP86_010765 [Hemibagrus guttatus]|nr:hypothetical protein QTP86_010765 [Hemibagrus guttatus]